MNFDRLARVYCGMEWMLAGGVLHRARTAWAAEAAGAGRILIAGDGPGRGVEALRVAAPRAEITVIEQSPAMIAVARRRLARMGLADGVRWIEADARRVGPGAVPSQDVIVTQFFLDCFDAEGVGRVVDALAALARPEAAWLLADFRVPEAGWRRWRAGAALGLAHGFFRVTTGLEATALTPPEPALARAGFAPRGRRLFSAGMVYSDWWARGA